MGLPMVKRLVSRGHAVTAFDIVPEKTEAARAAGAAAARSPAEACGSAELVLLNLPTTDAVEAAVFGERGVASAVKPPQIVVDFSTVKVEKGRAFAAKLKEKTGCGWVDAPVSGGPPASGSGTLTVEELNRAVKKGGVAAEDRIRRFGAGLDVVPTEAEDVLLDAAATARGVHETARQLREEPRRKPAVSSGRAPSRRT